MTVRLTDSEFNLCGVVGTLRSIAAFKRHGRYGAPSGEGSYEMHTIGCTGECAVAKYFNLYWPPAIGEFGGVDVGGILQVRASARSDRRLMLHRTDHDDMPFVLALSHALPDVMLRGWAYAREGKRPDFWEDPLGWRPAYFVPHEVLRPIDELMEVVHDRARKTDAW